ncbi:MAG: LuxR C-terminal-related transcriptional regulator [Kofleriaceae bacterium]
MDDNDEKVEPSAPIHALTAAEVAELALDSLDVGVVLVDATARLIKANSIAHHFIAAFDDASSVANALPRALWSGLLPAMDASKTVPGRFTPATPLTARDKRRFFARCRYVRNSGFLLTLAPAALREIDVARVLAVQFGLSAQEIRIAFFAAQGYRNREIAESLDIVEGTVKNYLTNVFAALSVRSRTELASELAQLVEEQTDIHRRGGGD